jgi:hypothetical protein
LTTVPDKREQSKQRRAARNRANREALAARREAAASSASSSGPSRATASKASPAKGVTSGAGGAGADAQALAPPKGIMGLLRSTRVGDKSVLAAFVFAVGAAIYLIFYQVPVDDRGEQLPAVFRGLAVAARERVIGGTMPEDTERLLDVAGPQILLVLGLPVLVAVFALWANLRRDRSRMLTFAMLAMAGSVILTGGIGIFFFPAMIALAIAGFRVRKADLPARTAERVAAAERRKGKGAVIDADSEDVTDASSDEASATADVADPDDDHLAADAADDGTVEDDETAEDDPLAQLEAELAADATANGTDEDTGKGRRRRS